jgi:hypothetical protein
VDPKNDRLSQHECHKLCNAVLSEEGNHELVDMVFQQMDRDNTGDVSWENFLNFFNVAEGAPPPRVCGPAGTVTESTTRRTCTRPVLSFWLAGRFTGPGLAECRLVWPARQTAAPAP